MCDKLECEKVGFSISDIYLINGQTNKQTVIMFMYSYSCFSYVFHIYCGSKYSLELGSTRWYIFWWPHHSGSDDEKAKSSKIVISGNGMFGDILSKSTPLCSYSDTLQWLVSPLLWEIQSKFLMLKTGLPIQSNPIDPNFGNRYRSPIQSIIWLDNLILDKNNR